MAGSTEDRTEGRPPKTHPTVVGLVAEAHASVDGSEYLTKSHCVDWLLDCLNAAVRPAVRKVILQSLEDYSHRNMAPAAEFGATLDRIQLALQVDAAFDDMELKAA